MTELKYRIKPTDLQLLTKRWLVTYFNICKSLGPGKVQEHLINDL